MYLKFLILLILININTSFAKNSNAPILVKSYKVENKEFYNKFTSIAKCSRNNSIDYYSKRSGVIEKIIAKEGQDIKQGSLILTMDDSLAKSKLKYLDSSLKSAKTTLERSKKLSKQHILTNKQLETAEVELNKSQHEYSETLKEYNDMIITSPINGRIGVIEATIGQNIKVGDYLFSIIGGDKLHILTELPESFCNQISYDTDITLINSDNQKIKGKVESYSSYITDKGTLPLKIESSEPNNFLHGSYIKVEFKLNRHTAKAIPEIAVLKNDHGNFVYKITNNNLIEQVYVTIGTRSENMCEITTDNIALEDLIVLEGITKVSAGMKVKLIN